MAKVTIGQIADELGISRNTVSKVFNGKKVPKKTKDLVLAKAKELNYKQMSSGFDENKKYNILLLSGKPLANFNYFLPIISAIETNCYKEGHNLFQYVCRTSSESLSFIEEYVKSTKIDGIVCIESFDINFVKYILSLNIPICFIDFCCDYSIKGDYDIITVDNFSPIREFIVDMVKKGKRSFTYIGDPNHCQSFRERYDAMLTTLINLDVPHNKKDDMLLNDSSYSYHTPAEIGNFLNLEKLSEVYICANDFIARNFIRLLESKNIKVPEQVSVMGFDNTSDSSNYSPQITTASTDRSELGRSVLSLLIDRINGGRKTSYRLTIKTDLVIKESSQ